MDWQSPAIPPTVRKPWQVFEEDLEEKLSDAQSQDEFADNLRERLRKVQARGALAAFLNEPEETQRQYAEISVMELSAYVNWRSKQDGPNLDTATEFEAAWDILDGDDKATWLPEDPRAFLAADAMWAPLLVDGPPPCRARTAVPPGGSAASVKIEAAAAASSGSNAAVSTITAPGTQPATMVKTESTAPPARKVPPAASDASKGADGQKPAVSPKDHKEGSEGLQAEKSAGDQQKAAEKAATLPQKGSELPTAPADSKGRSIHGRSVRACRMAPKPVSQDDIAQEPRAGVASKRSGRSSAAPKKRRTVRANVSEDDEEDPDGMYTDGEVSGAGNRRRRRASPRRNGTNGTLVAAPCTPVPPAPQRAAGVAAPLAFQNSEVPRNLCPEANEAVCCVCGKDEATDANDLALCDRCDRGFHQLCHTPVVHFFGKADEQWFCAPCTQALSRERKLRFKEGDFVWARYSADGLPWPARITRIDFCSLTDIRPYFAEYFDSPPSGGNWLSEMQITPWSEGPSFAAVRDNKRKTAVRLAEADGAQPISDASLAQAPVKPLPDRRGVLPVHLRYDATVRRIGASSRAAGETDAFSPPPTRMRRLRVKSPRQVAFQFDDLGTEAELSQQAAEMRELIEAARERQARLEREYDQQMSQSQSQALSTAGA